MFAPRMGLRGGRPPEHALATPFGTFGQCAAEHCSIPSRQDVNTFVIPILRSGRGICFSQKTPKAAYFFYRLISERVLGKTIVQIFHQPATALRHRSQMVLGEGCFSPVVSGPPFLRAVTSSAPLVHSWTPFCFVPPSQPSDTSASFPASLDQSP